MATDIGTRIKRAREKKRWSQQRLADALEVDRKTIDNWENGRTRPRSSVGAIEEVLGVDLSPSPPRSSRLSAEARAKMHEVLREDYGDEEGERLAKALIAHAEHLAAGRTPAAEEDDRRPESSGRDQRTAG